MQNMQPEVVRYRALKPRARLNEDAVLKIFQLKGGSKSASQLAALHGVSEKTVRDIWTRRTWSTETYHLDTSRPMQPIHVKNVGRPKGCKDSKPRKKKGQPVQIRMNDTNLKTKSQQNPTLATLPCQFSMDQKDLHDNRADYNPWPDIQGRVDNIHASMHHKSVDDELHEWSERSWCSPRLTDPFRRDWNPALLARLLSM